MQIQIIGNASAAAFYNPSPQVIALLNGMRLMGKPIARDRGYGNANEQQA